MTLTEQESLTIDSGGLRLGAHLSRPRRVGRMPALVLCHGFPSGPRGAATSAHTFPELADRVAAHAGWIALAFNLRGTGTSDGDFSVDGWVADLSAAVTAAASVDGVTGVWTAGFGEGGTIAVCQAADDDRVRGVAALGAPATGWARDAGRLLGHARRIGMIRTPVFPDDRGAWERAAALDVEAAARRLPPRSLLVVHGADDDVVPVDEGRALARAAAPSAELRVVNSAGHRLRHDPRAVALLLGWLDRQNV